MYSCGDFSYAPTVEDIVESYLTQSDPVKLFMDKYTEPSDKFVWDLDLYSEYSQWNGFKKQKPVTKTAFTRRLKKMGYEDFRPRAEDGEQYKAWSDIIISEKLIKDYHINEHKEYDTNFQIGNETIIQTEIDEYENKRCVQFWQTFNNQN